MRMREPDEVSSVATPSDTVEGESTRPGVMLDELPRRSSGQLSISRPSASASTADTSPSQVDTCATCSQADGTEFYYKLSSEDYSPRLHGGGSRKISERVDYLGTCEASFASQCGTVRRVRTSVELPSGGESRHRQGCPGLRRPLN